MTVGRFAPSPSGRMHLGNIFTALLAWLSVRSQNGKMILRIEDLDPDRSKKEYIDAIYEDLHWLGLDWDEEMPYQSSRDDIYLQYLQKLSTYPCFCSRNELHSASAPHASDGRMIYAGTCRNVTQKERAALTKKPSWRVRVPNETIEFTDGVFGKMKENMASEWGDFIVRRADGVYAYQLAVVCDDALGGVTEVVRGCDLLGASVPQIWLYRQFGFAVPRFYHVPLLVAPDGRRLSKREKSLDVSSLMERHSAEEIIGRLAYLSGLIPENTAISAEDLLPNFSWDKISRKSIIINEDF